MKLNQSREPSEELDVITGKRNTNEIVKKPKKMITEDGKEVNYKELNNKNYIENKNINKSNKILNYKSINNLLINDKLKSENNQKYGNNRNEKEINLEEYKEKIDLLKKKFYL